MLLTEYSLDENIFIKAYELSDENMKKSFTLFKKITINTRIEKKCNFVVNMAMIMVFKVQMKKT